MKFAAILPARMESTRFPGKLLKLLGRKPVLQHTYENVQHTGLFDHVYIATDSAEITAAAENFGGKVLLTGAHETGSDRIAEAAAQLEADIIINVQGDEPFINLPALTSLCQVFREDIRQEIDLASLKIKMTDSQEINNPNAVKVITDVQNNALYFSRLPLPYARDGEQYIPYYRHIGVYAFRKAALLAFASLPQTPLELAEKIECLRFLEHGFKIKMITTDFVGVGIDTPEDLERAEKLLHNAYEN